MRPERVRFALKIALTVLVLFLLLRALEWRNIAEALDGFRWRSIALAAALSALFAAARIWKWWLLATRNGLAASPAATTRAALFALAAGIVTPGRVGEVVGLGPYASSERGWGSALFVYDRGAELAVVSAFAVPACMIFGGAIGPGLAVGALTPLILFLIFFHVAPVRNFLSGFLNAARFDKLRTCLERGVAPGASYWTISICAPLFAYASVIALVADANAVDDWRFAALLPAVTLSNLVSITVGGLGVREGLAAFLLPLGGISAAAGAAAFFLVFVFTRAVPGLLGILWTLLHGGRRAVAG